MEKTFTTTHGQVTVRNKSLPIVGNTLDEGVEVSGSNVSPFWVFGNRNVSEMSTEEVENLINNHS